MSADPNTIIGGLYLGYGTHYVDLYCGTPPQRQTVIVDTGSSNTAFPCGECQDCGAGMPCQDCGAEKYHTDGVFEETASSTFFRYDCDSCSQRSECNSESDRCEIEQFYSEGSSWTAYEAMDTCYLGGYHNTAILNDNGSKDPLDPGHAAAFAFDTRIGCQTDVTGLFKTQLADGILGMCDSKQSFWHQMYRNHKIREKRFSLCFTRPSHALKSGSEAGAITLGGSDERLHDKSPMVYTTVAGTSSESESSTGYFDIHVREMYWREGKAGELALSRDDSAKLLKIQGAGAINDEGGVIVDSGTTDTYFSNLIQKQLKANWEKFSGQTWLHKKQTLSPEQVAELPTLLLQFAGDVAMNKMVAEEHGSGDPNAIPGLAGDMDLNHPYDVIVAIPASHYMEAMSDGDVTNRIYATEKDGSVIGANVMIGHDVMFDAQNMRIGWAESSCDYSGLVVEKYISAIAAVEESEDAMEAEDEEEEKMEDEKEEFDEDNTEEEIEEDNANIEEFVTKGGDLASFDDDDESREHFTKSKHNNSKNIEIPVDDLLDNPAYLGIGLAVLFMSGIVCVLKCCAPKRRRRKRSRKQQEIEMSDNGFKDNFRDEAVNDDDSDSGSEYSDDDDDSEEYGESKNV